MKKKPLLNMKKTLILLVTLMTIELPSRGQITSPWIKQPGFTAYMHPSFLKLLNATSRTNLTDYSIVGTDCPPGKIVLSECRLSRTEAITAALLRMGGGKYEMTKYGISMVKPNLIP